MSATHVTHVILNQRSQSTHTNARTVPNSKRVQEVEPLVTAAPEAGTPAQVTLLDACAAAARSHLHDGAYTADTIESALGCNINSLFADLPASPPSIAWALAHGGYKLRDRAVHVFTEAARVLRFQAVCASSGAPLIHACERGVQLL